MPDARGIDDAHMNELPTDATALALAGPIARFSNKLSGGRVCRGGNGSDALLGGMMADTLNGGRGDDRLSGGAGLNSLTGGPPSTP
jgi:Ca2+-binding RTX toxin-like protein